MGKLTPEELKASQEKAKQELADASKKSELDKEKRKQYAEDLKDNIKHIR